MNDTLKALQGLSRIPFAVRDFPKHPLTLEQATQIVHQHFSPATKPVAARNDS